MLTQTQLKEWLKYDADTGLFTRVKSPNGKNKAGEIAGTVDKHGYIKISVLGKSYKAHRLAWLYETGSFPTLGIDHKNTKRSDNRFDNLREATQTENMKNKTKPKHNTSGKTGVHKRKGKLERYDARITVDGVRIHIGSYKNFEDAVQARLDAEVKYGYTTKEEVAPVDTTFEDATKGRGDDVWTDDGTPTKKSLAAKIWYNQRSNSRTRGHRMPEYTKKELYEWMMSQEIFHKLFSEWKESGFDTWLRPSVDRKCDDIHYCMNNIQLMTWQENADKNTDSKVYGTRQIDQMAVSCYDKVTGEYIATYQSQSEAARELQIKQANISKAIRGTIATAYGMIWKKN